MKNLLYILVFIIFILSENTLSAQSCSCQDGSTIMVGDVGTGMSQSVLVGTGGVGQSATGGRSTLIGFISGRDLTSGTLNTAYGSASLTETTTGRENTGIGESALRLNITGSYNTVVGNRALGHNGGNTVIDFWRNTNYNTAMGNGIGAGATGDGDHNTMIGSGAFVQFSGGSQNAGLGVNAGRNTGGSHNVYLGGNTGKYNVGDYNIFIGSGMRFLSDQSYNNHLFIGNTNNTEFIIGDIANGKLGINTNTPQNALDVCGKIRGDEVIIENNWCDFVFYKNYNLPTLTQEAQHIEEEGHLIGFESEEDMNGEIHIADVTKRQQVKIEEMMLHLIEMNERLNELEAENKQLKAALEKK